MDEVGWIEWLLKVTQDDIRPAIAGAIFTPKFFEPAEAWSKAVAHWETPERAWARGLPAAELNRYRRELTTFFSQQVPKSEPTWPAPVGSAQVDVPPRPLSDTETRVAVSGLWHILVWLRRPRTFRGVSGHWRILPLVSQVPSGGFNPDVGHLFLGVRGRRGIPFVDVEYSDRGLRVIEWFARLIAAHWNRIRTCDNPDCKRVFVAVKRQINCDVRCQNLKSQRVYRESLRTDAKKRVKRRLAQKVPYKRRLAERVASLKQRPSKIQRAKAKARRSPHEL